MTAEANLVAELQAMGVKVLRFVPGIALSFQVDDSTYDKALRAVRAYGFAPIRMTQNIFEADLLHFQPRYEIAQ
jgi:hypothetical protein